jgi:hypothetical protein
MPGDSSAPLADRYRRCAFFFVRSGDRSAATVADDDDPCRPVGRSCFVPRLSARRAFRSGNAVLSATVGWPDVKYEAQTRSKPRTAAIATCKPSVVAHTVPIRIPIDMLSFVRGAGWSWRTPSTLYLSHTT